MQLPMSIAMSSYITLPNAHTEQGLWLDRDTWLCGYLIAKRSHVVVEVRGQALSEKLPN